MVTTAASESAKETAPRFSSEPLNISVDRFREIADWLAQRPGVPAAVVNAVKAAVWLAEVDAFRAREEKLMVEGQYNEMLPVHRAVLSGVISQGEEILLLVRKLGMVPEIGFTPEDLQATLDSLHTTFRCEHGPRNSPRTNELIEKLFAGAKS